MGQPRGRSHKAAAKDTPKSTAATATAAFLAWCKQVKLLHPKCSIDVLPGTGRGVVAIANIACGEVVITVPDDIVLMAEASCISEELEGETCCHAALPRGVA